MKQLQGIVHWNIKRNDNLDSICYNILLLFILFVESRESVCRYVSGVHLCFEVCRRKQLCICVSALKMIAKFSGKHTSWNPFAVSRQAGTPLPVLPWETCEIFQNNYFQSKFV